MKARFRWVVVAATALALILVYYYSTRTIDFRSYHIGITGYFEGVRPVYGALSGMGWPMHYRYPPLFIFLFWPLTLLPLSVAAGVWTSLKFVALVCLVRILVQRLSFPARNWWIPFFIAGPYVIREFRSGNAEFFIFVLVAMALLVSKTSPIRAGVFLALATSVKVWPLFFFPYLGIRREWRVLGWATSLTIVLTMLPTIYFGFDGMINLLGDWARQEFATQAGPTEHWQPNPSLRGLLMRYLTVIDYSELPDSEYAQELAGLGAPFVPDSNYVQVHVAELDPFFVRMVWLGLEALTYAGFLALTYYRRTSVGWAGHGIAFCAVLLLQPFTQQQALSALLWPALVVGALAKNAETPFRVRFLVYGSAVLAGLQPFVPGQRYLQVLGVDALVILFLAAALIWASLCFESKAATTN